MDLLVLKGMLLGGIAIGTAVASLFFLRFWLKTSDRLFLYFSLAFLILAVNRIVMAIAVISSDDHPIIYLMRSFAYGLIILAIVDKNRKKSVSFVPPHEHVRKT